MGLFRIKLKQNNIDVILYIHSDSNTFYKSFSYGVYQKRLPRLETQLKNVFYFEAIIIDLELNLKM